MATKAKAKAKTKRAAKTKLFSLREFRELKAQLEEQEETLRAIRNGEVDALLVSTPKGEQVYTLKGAEQIYRVFIETMHEGALLLSSDGVILYANNRFSEMVGLPLEQLINSPLRKFIPASDRAVCKSLLAAGIRERCSDEITLRGAGRKTL